MQPQLNVPLAALSENIRPLFDPARPLPSDVWFLPYKTDTFTFVFDLVIFGVLVGGAFAGSGLFGLVVLTVSILNGSYTISDSSDYIVYVVVYLLLGGLLLTGWHNFWRPLWIEAMAVREERSRRLRRGLFLTPDAMIVRRYTERYDVLPRDAILSADLRGFRRKTLYMMFRMPDGKRKTYDLFGSVPFGNIDHRSAQRHIQKWANLEQDP